MNGHSGYIFEGDHTSPPDGFPDIHEIIIDKKFDINQEKLEKYSKKYNFPSGDTCIVIGSNPTIRNFELGDAIDSSDIFTFRINRNPDQSISKNCGSRTDMFLGCTFHKSLLSKVNNKVIFDDSMILDISRDFFLDKRWFTTGFIGILFALYNFKKVYVYGFGNPYEDEDYSSEKHVYDNASLVPKNHSLRFEHALIRKFREDSYKDRFFIVEAGDSFV